MLIFLVMVLLYSTKLATQKNPSNLEGFFISVGHNTYHIILEFLLFEVYHQIFEQACDWLYCLDESSVLDIPERYFHEPTRAS